MKVMLLAAGKGERMRPLTESLPKPLLPIAGSTLIELQIGKLRQAGFRELVINASHLGDILQAKLGDGSRFGVSILWSREAEPLETGGGIKQALPLLGDQPFGIVNADIHTDLDYAWLHEALPQDTQARLVMVDNPPHHPEGDFALAADGRLVNESAKSKLTYSGISIMRPELVADEPAAKFGLRTKLDEAIAKGVVSGFHHQGFWCDVGTVDRYEKLKARLATDFSG